jgi:hypothetical protein
VVGRRRGEMGRKGERAMMVRERDRNGAPAS